MGSVVLEAIVLNIEKDSIIRPKFSKEERAPRCPTRIAHQLHMTQLNTRGRGGGVWKGTVRFRAGDETHWDSERRSRDGKATGLTRMAPKRCVGG